MSELGIKRDASEFGGADSPSKRATHEAGALPLPSPPPCGVTYKGACAFPSRAFEHSAGDGDPIRQLHACIATGCC